MQSRQTYFTFFGGNDGKMTRLHIIYWVDEGGCWVDVKTTSTQYIFIINQLLISILGGCGHHSYIFVYTRIISKS